MRSAHVAPVRKVSDLFMAFPHAKATSAMVASLEASAKVENHLHNGPGHFVFKTLASQLGVGTIR